MASYSGFDVVGTRWHRYLLTSTPDRSHAIMNILEKRAKKLSNLFKHRTMENLYEKIIERVTKGARCSVDFKKRTLNGKPIEIEGNESGIKEFADLDEWLDEVENLYDDYKYSKPSQRTMKRERKSKFRALSVSELVSEIGHDALSNPITRDVAQAKLEVFILLSLVYGIFNPDELFAKDWFYQGADKSLIIRKDWF